MAGFKNSLPRTYAAAVGLVAVASILTLAITPWLHGYAPMLLFVIAVAVAASYGGLGPGLVATALSLAVVWLFFTDKIYQLTHARPNMGGFAVVAVTISILMAKLRRTNELLLKTKNELEIANVRLSERTEALSRSNEELKRFAYALSHDLQTPLRSVKVFTELLMNTAPERMNEESERAAEFITSGVERMQSMITGLLDYSTASVEPGPVARADCNAILRDVLLNLDSIIAESGAFVTSEPLPVVHANRSGLSGVFSNMIENAIKYRDESRAAKVHVSAKPDGDHWVFAVRDNGIGIDMQYADRIFEVFQRLHPWSQHDGNGIGLAICRATIERHGGKIWIESEPGKGSTFLFTLPMHSEAAKSSTSAV